MNRDEFDAKIEKAKRKAKRISKRIKDDTEKVCNWIRENPREAIILGTGLFTAIGAASKGVANMSRTIQDINDKKDESTRIWNPVDGLYLYTKRPLTGKQKLEFETRVQSGEARAAVLDSMGVLDRRR